MPKYATYWFNWLLYDSFFDILGRTLSKGYRCIKGSFRHSLFSKRYYIFLLLDRIITSGPKPVGEAKVFFESSTNIAESLSDSFSSISLWIAEIDKKKLIIRIIWIIWIWIFQSRTSNLTISFWLIGCFSDYSSVPVILSYWNFLCLRVSYGSPSTVIFKRFSRNILFLTPNPYARPNSISRIVKNGVKS